MVQESTTLSSLLAQCKDLPLRSIILSDLLTDTHIAASFSYPYDIAQSNSIVAQLFDQTVQLLKNVPVKTWDVQDLPIARYVGMYRVTHVIKDPMGDISLHDGEALSPDHYTGVE